MLVAEAPLDGYGDGGCLHGKYCFAATGHHSRRATRTRLHGRGHGLEIFDVSQPTQPVFVSRVKFPTLYSIFNDMWSARVGGGHCVVADTYNGLFVVDVRDVARPAIVAHAQLPLVAGQEYSDPVGGVALAEGVIYAAGIYTGLYVVPAPAWRGPWRPSRTRRPFSLPCPKTPADGSRLPGVSSRGPSPRGDGRRTMSPGRPAARPVWQAVRLGDELPAGGRSARTQATLVT